MKHLKQPNLTVDLNGLTLHNPITVASGTFGFGREYADFVDLNKIGAISVKGLTLEPRKGNPGVRMAETPMGMINSVGLQNPGVHKFIEEEIDFIRQFQTKIIANINGNTIEEYCEIAKVISQADVDSLELNISCPNVKCGGMAFGTDPAMVREVVRAVRKSTDKHLIVKLSPNVTDIRTTAKAAEEEGADALSLINTLTGMAIDIHRRKPVIDRKIGGVSGPAVKPVALRMVYEVAQSVDIPVLGMGGISNWEDTVEFLLAGASAVALGTANFRNPLATEEALEGLIAYMNQNQMGDIHDLIGGLKE